MTQHNERIDIPKAIEDVLALCEDAESRAAMIRGHQEMSDDYFRECIKIKPEIKRIHRVKT